MRTRSNAAPLTTLQQFTRTYRTPVALGMVFCALVVLFAVTPDPHNAAATGPQSTSEPTPGPHECLVCGIDQTCNAKTGQCMFVDHTPLPCVESAKYDDKAGFCLPEGVPAAPQTSVAPGVRIPGPVFPPGIRPRRPRQRTVFP